MRTGLGFLFVGVLFAAACVFEPDRERVLLTVGSVTVPETAGAGAPFEVVLDSIHLSNSCFSFDQASLTEADGVIRIEPRGWKLLGGGCREAFQFAGPVTVGIPPHDAGPVTIQVLQPNAASLIRHTDVR